MWVVVVWAQSNQSSAQLKFIQFSRRHLIDRKENKKFEIKVWIIVKDSRKWIFVTNLVWCVSLSNAKTNAAIIDLNDHKFECRNFQVKCNPLYELTTREDDLIRGENVMRFLIFWITCLLALYFDCKSPLKISRREFFINKKKSQ